MKGKKSLNEGLIGSILSALSTGFGAMIILFMSRNVTHRWRDALLTFTAGVMVAASTMGLIPEELN